MLLNILFIRQNTHAQTLTPVLENYRPLKNAVSVNRQAVWDDFTDEIPLQYRRIVPGFVWHCDRYFFDTLFIGQGRILAEKNDALINIGVFEDLCDRGIGTDSSLSPILYTISGRRGRRILKVEWENAGYFEDWSYRGYCDRHLHFQLWLYEKDSRVELHCRPENWYRDAALALRHAEVRLLLPGGQKIFAVSDN